MAELPLCETYERGGGCPKSDVRHCADHGPPQALIYSTFKCRTCRTLFIKFAPEYVARAKRGQLDMGVDMRNRLDDGSHRFDGYYKKDG